MERENLILGGILVAVFLIIFVLALAYSGNNTFQMGKISFEYPDGWSQASTVGNFSNTSLYSEVTFTASFSNTNGTSQPAYIIVQMQEKIPGSINLPSTSTIVNTTDSSVSSVNVSNITATQLGNYNTNMAEKTTIIQQGNYYFVITFITPSYAINQTTTAYNMILQTLSLS